MSPTFKKDIEEGRAVSVQPLADALNTSPVCVYQAIRRGEIKHTRIAKRVIIPNRVARALLGLDTDRGEEPGL